jgi:hypothetical protein
LRRKGRRNVIRRGKEQDRCKDEKWGCGTENGDKKAKWKHRKIESDVAGSWKQIK